MLVQTEAQVNGTISVFEPHRAYDPPREFGWVVGDRFDGTPATRWAFRVFDHPAGCRLRQEFRHLPDGLSGLRLRAQAHPEQAADLIAARQRDLRAAMTATLQRMSVVLTTSRAPTGVATAHWQPDHHRVRDQLEPFTELFDAEINLALWVAAVRLQRERLRASPPDGPDREVSGEEVWSWLSRLGADGLMFVLALDQVADAAQAIRFHVPQDVTADVDDAIARFESACPDRRRLRNAIVHYSDYLRGAGDGQRGGISPTATYGLVDTAESVYFYTDDDRDPLEVSFSEAADAAIALAQAIDAALARARARGREIR
jgi:hypothetical protein